MPRTSRPNGEGRSPDDESDPQVTECPRFKRIASLVAEYIEPALAEANAAGANPPWSEDDESLMEMLRDPYSGELTREVNKLYETGCHALHCKRVHEALLLMKKDYADVARFFGTDPTTEYRHLVNGTGSAKHLSAIEAEFLRGPPVVTPDELFVAGHCHVNSNIADRIARLVPTAGHRKPMNPVDLCYLWHTLFNETWRLGMINRDEHHPTCLHVVKPDSTAQCMECENIGQGLNRACTQIFDRVRSKFPRSDVATYKGPIAIQNIHREWGLTFRIVQFARPSSIEGCDADSVAKQQDYALCTPT